MQIEEAIKHCYDIANQSDTCDGCRDNHLQLAHWLEELISLRKILSNSKELIAREVLIETNIFDKEEIYENCTVQILENSITGEISVGWWRNE